MMSDADVDGSHIRTLLMTFFYRQMPRLVAEGHLYVAQPPLYMLTQKKVRRYVQTEPEMQAILVEAGLADAKLVPHGKQGGEPIEGERLRALNEIVVGLDGALRAFGRRNRPVRDFLGLTHPATDPKVDPRSGLLPLFLVESHDGDQWLYSAEELDSFQSSQAPPVEGNGEAAGPRVTELHEVRVLNKWLARLRDDYAIRADALLPLMVLGDDPPPRYILERDGDEHPLLDLRSLAATIRHLGEKGMKITRFKGLGEMDADQLWDTTMDPTRRTLLQVKLDDVAAANDLFTTLMGDDVEPRRQFIEKHALEVKNLDV